MTRNSKRGVEHTEETKRAAVAAYLARGDRSVEDVAAEFGVHKSGLYEWTRRIKAGDPLVKPRGGAAHKLKKTAKATRRKPAPDEIATRKPGVLMRAKRPDVAAIVAPNPKQTELHFELEASYRTAPIGMTASERDELVLLRAEVRKLKRALIAYAELEGGR